MLMTFDNTNLASFAKSKGWDNPLPPFMYNPADDSHQTRDFLAIAEGNLGANKVNRFLERKISYDMTIGKDADLIATLKITYKNNSQAETWPAGKYVNFLRVYTPFASGLLEYQNGENNDIEEVETTTAGNLTIFSTFVEVPIKSQKEIIIKYRIPKNINLELSPAYSLYVQKQPGTQEDSFTFTFNLPSFLGIKTINGSEEFNTSRNFEDQTNLSKDKLYEVKIQT